MTGDRVSIVDKKHPWYGHSGEVVAMNERYGLGWIGDRVALDGNCGETFVCSDQVISHPPPRLPARRKGNSERP